MPWRMLNAAVSVVVLGALLLVSGRGVTGIPPLGVTFNPGTGVWTASAETPRSETLRLTGLRRPASVLFERNGIAHVNAGSTHDLFLAMGYLHARFRLFEMDLLRRQGEGLLSQIVGKAALSSDRFELRLGLQRTAQANWRATSPEGRMVLRAYAQGVNDRIAEARQRNQLPLLFRLLGYTPRRWMPVDSLVIQGIMTQTLAFTDTPLDYAVLARTLGYARTMRWFPVLPPNVQRPYDPGPYRGRARLTPLPAQTAQSGAVFREVAGVLSAIPAQVARHGGNSNNWAVNGPAVAGGKALMAGDPHLHQTLPAIWYELTLDAPGYHAAGVSIPGAPAVLIGRNRHISWSLTNTQNQATLYYRERTRPGRPRQYFWRGAWRRMRRLRYTIPLKGGGTSALTVYLTVHGPVMNSRRAPGTISVDWMGNLTSLDLDVLLRVARASTFAQFKAALRGWRAPTQNFVYADDRGNIGMIAAGAYPQVRAGAPWLPLPGDGSADIVGTIPYSAVPQVYNPRTHLVFSANQRPVGPNYPYYIGTTLDFFDNGYRANRIWQVLQGRTGLTRRDMERLQLDTRDYLAGRIVPRLLGALRGARLSGREQQAAALLRGWDGSMTAASPAATVWWAFWHRYIHATFDPWWRAKRVPFRRFPSVQVSTNLAPLDEILERWTVSDQRNPAFTPPGKPGRAAREVMRQAFRTAITVLSRRLGPRPALWRWGRIHRRTFPSLAQIPALGYGPRSSGGSAWTVNAADGGLLSDQGPSWRFVVDWGAGTAEGVYPGGQSENPLSPWYEDGVAVWWSGRYRPLLGLAAARGTRGSVTWSFRR